MAPDGRMSRGRFVEWIVTKDRDVMDAQRAWAEAYAGGGVGRE